MATPDDWTLVALSLALLGPLALAWAGERSSSNGRARRYPFLVAQGVLATLVTAVLGIALLAEGAHLTSLGLRRGLFDPSSWLWGAALAAFFVFVYGPLAYRVLRGVGTNGFDTGLNKLADLPVSYLVLAVLVGGVAEEFLYRAYAFERLLDLTDQAWLAGGIPLVLFAGAHAPLWGFPAALSTLLSGVLLTLFYAWQRDLVANVVAHCVTDVVGVILPVLRARQGGGRQ